MHELAAAANSEQSRQPLEGLVAMGGHGSMRMQVHAIQYKNCPHI